ncbi:sulfatase family protein [Tunicatimonas pelagia]|uniref:sulfatase family protein n=1 Tax=Tunicatimonas pelagia TaxID=931531 RepID=UPI002666B227|nr:arylsulfatase [Tunicatimonas pelagia]WKN41801.1 arylsulfatase [Tunicatimonas pelagia]
MFVRIAVSVFLISLCSFCLSPQSESTETPPSTSSAPNIVLIYTDDVGYGDVSSYGATEISTPHIDRLAEEGLRFTDAHTTSATCTPSRYGLLTGQYPWRKDGTGIARGDAALIIDPDRFTLPDLLKQAGYATSVVGKWHLGLGPAGGPDWNGEINPSPLDIGFDESFLIPATGDRVPTVYVENRRVVGLDPADPIEVSFSEKVGDEPTGRDNPELLKMHPSHGHDMTIVNGISRIGYMTGGQAARWVDEDMADTITARAVSFIERNQEQPFFLYFSTHDIHVPRVPHPRFVGKSGMGSRGDAMLQLDWSVGQLLQTLDSLQLTDNTIVIFTSDNGPVVDDGYHDEAVEKLGNHTPAGPFRGGKYSVFEAGTRVPLLIRWPSEIAPSVSGALVSQIDFLASLATLTEQSVPSGAATDSQNNLDVLLGDSEENREFLIEHAASGALSLIKGKWKYIEPNDRPFYNENTDTELGNMPEPQLYDLSADQSEQQNVADQHPEVLTEMQTLLKKIRDI